jgi:hypothetical protein
MPLDFPNSPIIGQTFSSGTRKWTWTGEQWSAANIISIPPIPTGFVSYYSLSSAPEGWLECNGTALTVALGPSYTDLRTLLVNVGNPFGVSGSDPRIPDLRGRFIRSFGSDGTYTSGTFGAKQADEFKSHDHSYSFRTDTVYGGMWPNSGFGGGATGRTTGSAGGTETRPANLALLACIKL